MCHTSDSKSNIKWTRTDFGGDMVTFEIQIDNLISEG